VSRVINPGVDVPSSRAAVALAQQREGIYAAVGIHPHDAKTLDVDALEELKGLAQSPKVVAICVVAFGSAYLLVTRRRAWRAAS